MIRSQIVGKGAIDPIRWSPDGTKLAFAREDEYCDESESLHSIVVGSSGRRYDEIRGMYED